MGDPNAGVLTLVGDNQSIVSNALVAAGPVAFPLDPAGNILQSINLSQKGSFLFPWKSTAMPVDEAAGAEFVIMPVFSSSPNDIVTPGAPWVEAWKTKMLSGNGGDRLTVDQMVSLKDPWGLARSFMYWEIIGEGFGDNLKYPHIQWYNNHSMNFFGHEYAIDNYDGEKGVSSSSKWSEFFRNAWARGNGNNEISRGIQSDQRRLTTSVEALKDPHYNPPMLALEGYGIPVLGNLRHGINDGDTWIGSSVYSRYVKTHLYVGNAKWEQFQYATTRTDYPRGWHMQLMRWDPELYTAWSAPLLHPTISGLTKRHIRVHWGDDGDTPQPGVLSSCKGLFVGWIRTGLRVIDTADNNKYVQGGHVAPYNVDRLTAYINCNQGMIYPDDYAGGNLPSLWTTYETAAIRDMSVSVAVPGSIRGCIIPVVTGSSPGGGDLPPAPSPGGGGAPGSIPVPVPTPIVPVPAGAIAGVPFGLLPNDSQFEVLCGADATFDTELSVAAVSSTWNPVSKTKWSLRAPSASQVSMWRGVRLVLSVTGGPGGIYNQTVYTGAVDGVDSMSCSVLQSILLEAIVPARLKGQPSFRIPVVFDVQAINDNHDVVSSSMHMASVYVNTSGSGMLQPLKASPAALQLPGPDVQVSLTLSGWGTIAGGTLSVQEIVVPTGGATVEVKLPVTMGGSILTTRRLMDALVQEVMVCMKNTSVLFATKATLRFTWQAPGQLDRIVDVTVECGEGVNPADSFDLVVPRFVTDLQPDWAQNNLVEFRNTRSAQNQRNCLLKALYCLMYCQQPQVESVLDRLLSSLRSVDLTAAQSDGSGDSAAQREERSRVPGQMSFQARVAQLSSYLKVCIATPLNEPGIVTVQRWREMLQKLEFAPNNVAPPEAYGMYAGAGRFISDQNILGPLRQILLLVIEAVEAGNQSIESYNAQQKGAAPQANMANRPVWGFNAAESLIWAVGTITARAMAYKAAVAGAFLATGKNPEKFVNVAVTIASKVPPVIAALPNAFDFVIPRGFITSVERRDQINFFLANGIGQEPAVRDKFNADFPFGPTSLNAQSGVYDDLIPLFNLVGKQIPGITYPTDGGQGANALPASMAGASQMANGAGLVNSVTTTGNTLPGVVAARIVDPQQFASMQGYTGLHDVIRRPPNFHYDNPLSIEMEAHRRYWFEHHRAALASLSADDIRRLNNERPRRAYKRKVVEAHVGVSAPQRLPLVTVGPEVPKDLPRVAQRTGPFKLVAGPAPSQLRKDPLFVAGLQRHFFQ